MTAFAPASALDCRSSDDDLRSAGFYVDFDYCDLDPCVWIYQESNGVEGLQRSDEYRDDTDQGRCYPADTLIF